MAKIHVLESDGDVGYKVIIHFHVPIGNNSAGLSWKSCGLGSKLTGSTILRVGTEPGNITQSEYDLIISGDIIEIVKTINPGINPTNASVEALTNVLITEYQTNMTNILKHFGYEIK